MAYKVEKLPDEPIILDTHMEPVSAANYEQFAAELAALAQNIEGPIYRVVDMRQMNFSFSTLVHVFAEEARVKRPGSVGDPRVNTVIVALGETAALTAATAHQAQYGARGMPVFEDTETALAYVRDQIEKGKE